MMRAGVREVAWQLELFTIQGRDVCRPGARDISCHAFAPHCGRKLLEDTVEKRHLKAAPRETF